jgi:hypothetical protein
MAAREQTMHHELWNRGHVMMEFRRAGILVVDVRERLAAGDCANHDERLFS